MTAFARDSQFRCLIGTMSRLLQGAGSLCRQLLLALPALVLLALLLPALAAWALLTALGRRTLLRASTSPSAEAGQRSEELILPERKPDDTREFEQIRRGDGEAPEPHLDERGQLGCEPARGERPCWAERRRRSGFTLIECLVLIAIIARLTAMLFAILLTLAAMLFALLVLIQNGVRSLDWRGYLKRFGEGILTHAPGFDDATSRLGRTSPTYAGDHPHSSGSVRSTLGGSLLPQLC